MDYIPIEMMTVVASPALENDEVCLVGIGAPSAACNLARLTRCPDITLIDESGAIATRPDVLALSIGDGELCQTALNTVPEVEMFRCWLQGGRITKGFPGAAQMDKFANINTTVIGDDDKPKVRLPGGGGAPEIATHPGVTRGQLIDATGWVLRFADGVAATLPPTGEELDVLRDLHARTEKAHGRGEAD